MSLDLFKAELGGILKGLASDLEDEYREEAEAFLKQAAEDLAKQAWKAKTASSAAERETALGLMDDVRLSAELLASEVYLTVADRAEKRYDEIRDRLKTAVRVAAGVLKTSIKLLGPLLAG
jgi:hypothetical protein